MLVSKVYLGNYNSTSAKRTNSTFCGKSNYINRVESTIKHAEPKIKPEKPIPEEETPEEIDTSSYVDLEQQTFDDLWAFLRDG